MNARVTSNAHVCLRCQLRLSRRPTVTKSTSLRATSARRNTSRLQHDDAQNRKPAKGFKSFFDEEDEEEINFNDTTRGAPISYSASRRRDPPRPRLSALPLGRTRGKWGHTILRENTEVLDAQTLGAPAEVVVLRDAKLKFIPPASQEVEDEDAEKVDILATLDAERGLISQKEVEDNIEDLRPKTQEPVSWEEFESLGTQLRDGFTSRQLVGYLKSFRDREKEKVKVEKTDSSSTMFEKRHSVVLKKSSWQPGISQPESTNFNESPLRGYDSVAYTYKQHLAVQILRECWSVDVREVTEQSFGELELMLGDVELELLINSKGSEAPLKMLSDRHLSHQDEKIEAFRPRRVIRITAAKQKAEVMSKEIEEMVHNIHALVIDTKPLQTAGDDLHAGKPANLTLFSKLTDVELETLSQLTSAQIIRGRNNNLKVYSINRAAGSGLSTPSDVVRRLLLTSSPISDLSDRHVIFRNPAGQSFPIPVQTSEALSWRERLHNWVRFSSPILKGKDEKYRGVTPTFREFTYHTGSIEPIWAKEAKTSSSVIVGKVIHPSLVTKIEESNSLPSYSRFVPAFQNLSQLMKIVTHKLEALEPSMLMKFLPSPWTKLGESALTRFPPVELHFEVNRFTKTPSHTKTLAIMQKDILDMMIPDRSVDLRFMQFSSIDLDSFTIASQADDFMAASRTNPVDGNLETPPKLTLSLPPHILGRLSNELHIEDGSVSVDYIFAGLEYRNTIDLQFGSYSASYASIERGRADGRRGELSLHLRPLPATKAESGTQDVMRGNFEQNLFWQNGKHRDFVAEAYRLVDVIESGVSGISVRNVTSHEL